MDNRIKKIKKIENLAIFSNFEWSSDCPAFKNFNFFYGWNYSCKTSLSRLFRCLEEKKLHPDYPNLKFTLNTEASDISEKDIGREFLIRVFNEDFVEENFRWNNENHRISPVLIFRKRIN